MERGHAAAEFGQGRTAVRLVHRGAWSDTFEATVDEDPPRRVAIKTASSVGREALVARYVARAGEVRVALPHPVFVHLDSATHRDEWLVAERRWIEGVDIATALDHTEPPGASVGFAIAHALFSAVAMAHDRDVVVGRITPSHVMVARDGSIFLLHAGLPVDVGRVDPDRTAAVDPETSYAPPERFAGAPALAPADVFGVSAVLFGLLRGAPAIPVGHRLGRILARRGGIEVSSATPLEGVNPTLEPLLRRALDADDSARPDAHTLAEAMGQHAGDRAEVAAWARLVLGSAALLG